MLSYDDLDQDQIDLIERLYNFDITLVYATMGSGKSVCSLTAASELLEEGVITRVVVFAPLKPANDVWKDEHLKWRHLKHLNIAMATGNPKQRMTAINSDADIVVINLENLAWFFDTFKRTHNFDGVIIDELSKFKSNSTKMVKKLRRRTKYFNWKVGLTGSPVHEDFVGLFSQLLVLDGGKTFGTNKEKFLLSYFFPTDYEQRNWEVRHNRFKPLLNKLVDVWYSMPDYTHKLPPVNEINVPFDLSPDGMSIYKSIKRDSVFIDEEQGIEIIADNAAVLSGKLEQVTSGFIYDDDHVVNLVDLSRQKAFKQLRSKLKNKRCIIFYAFEEEKKQIIDVLDNDYHTLDDKNVGALWNAKKVNNFILHPKSASHGLNYAQGGYTIIWFSPIWSNDSFKQAVARLWRRGQKNEVTSYNLVCQRTIDEIKILRVEDKQEHDKLLRDHFNS